MLEYVSMSIEFGRFVKFNVHKAFCGCRCFDGAEYCVGAFEELNDSNLENHNVYSRRNESLFKKLVYFKSFQAQSLTYACDIESFYKF